jgi:hypothetical protein
MMKSTTKPVLSLTQILHTPVQGNWAFFTVLGAACLGIAALRYAPKDDLQNGPFVTRNSAANPGRNLPMPPPPNQSYSSTDSLGMPALPPLGEFYIGVFVESLDPALAAQLKIKNGIVVRHVVPDSPAEKAGVKINDILTRAGDTELEQVCFLGNTVNTLKETEIPFEVLREGAPLALMVTPAKRPAKMWTPPSAETVSLDDPSAPGAVGKWIYVPADKQLAEKMPGVALANDPAHEKSLEALEQKLAQAQAEIDALRDKLAKLQRD